MIRGRSASLRTSFCVSAAIVAERRGLQTIRVKTRKVVYLHRTPIFSRNNGFAKSRCIYSDGVELASKQQPEGVQEWQEFTCNSFRCRLDFRQRDPVVPVSSGDRAVVRTEVRHADRA